MAKDQMLYENLKTVVQSVDVRLTTAKREMDKLLTDKTLVILDEADDYYLNR